MQRRASFKTGLLTVGAVALALVTTAATLPMVLSGPASGEWNLPRRGDGGFAAGVLVDADTGRPAFKMRARLLEGPSTSVLRQRGRIMGRLFRPSLSSAANRFPIYSINGTWVGNRLTGEGQFRGIISVQRSPRGPIVQIGAMHGKYDDPPRPSPMAFSRVGRFRAEWKASL